MKLGNRIRRIPKVDAEHYRVRLQFEDGTRETVDLRFLFCRVKRGHLVLEILRGQLFGKCFVESGALAWPNGYEICPDAIRHWIQQQPGQRAA